MIRVTRLTRSTVADDCARPSRRTRCCCLHPSGMSKHRSLTLVPDTTYDAAKEKTLATPERHYSLMNLITILKPPYDSLFAPGNPSLLPSTLVDDSTSLRYSFLVPSCRCCLRVTWHSNVTFVTVIVTVHKWPLLDSHLLQIAIRKSQPNWALDKPVNNKITNLNTRT